MTNPVRLRQLFTVISTLCLTLTGSAQSPSVEGTWVIVPSRGDAPLMGRHPAAAPEDLLDGRLTIRLSGAEAVVDASAGSRVLSRSYQLNASDDTPFRGTALDGILIVQRLEVIQLPAGEAAVDTLERYTVQPDGTLLLERTITVGGRSSIRRHVFQRKR